MKIKVTIEVPNGKTCGGTVKEYCRFLKAYDEQCLLFKEPLSKSGRYHLKCSTCQKAEVVDYDR